jgi:hypothetical protein
MWWVEEGEQGAATHGKNEWLEKRTNYGTKARLHAAVPHLETHDHIHSALPKVPHMFGGGGGEAMSESEEAASAPEEHEHMHGEGSSHEAGAHDAHGEGHGHGGHRRLRGDESRLLLIPRPLVPAAVKWPAAFLEPDFLACGPSAAAGGAAAHTLSDAGPIAALAANGLGAIVPPAAGAGKIAAAALPFALQGIDTLGFIRGVTWGSAGIHVAIATGDVAHCGSSSISGKMDCRVMAVPKLSSAAERPQSPAAVFQGASEASPLRAAVAMAPGLVVVSKLVTGEAGQNWKEIGAFDLPGRGREVVSLTAAENYILAMTNDGTAHRFQIFDDDRLVPVEPRDIPMAGTSWTWRSACTLPAGRVVRLAAQWRDSWQHELLL